MVEVSSPIPAIETRGLMKKFKELVAVKPLDLRVERGEIFGFLGPNGAGKTTTIRMLAGLLAPTEGTASISGYDVERERMQVRRNIGYMSATLALYGRLKGREYLEFMAELWGHDLATVGPRIQKLLALFELDERAEDLIYTYSTGMSRKLYLAAILAHEPQMLFLDEPTSGMDTRSARLVKELFKALAAQGKTIFLTTHILEIAESICTRIGIINEGELVAVGTMEELRELAQHGGSSLEDIFLHLTGGPKMQEFAEFLAN